MLQSHRICLITNRYPAHPDDVASPFVRDFHVGLKKKGLDVSVFTPHYHTTKIEWTEDVVRFHWRGGEKVVGSLSFFNPGELLDLFSFFKNGKRQLTEYLKQAMPDQCLALWALPSGWFAYQAKKELGIPYSVWCLGSDIYVWAKKPILHRITKKVLQEADYLFADGFDLKEKVEELSDRKCLFLPSMRKLPPESEKRAQLDSTKFNFLYIGRWEKKKGVDDLIQAFDLACRKLSHINLYILGWGELEDAMKKLVKKLKLEDTVKIIGKVSASLVADYIKQADCVVIPSEGDSIPLVFSEVLQMGTPLIVTDVGDMGYLVRKFNLGKVIPKGDLQKLAWSMIEFASEQIDYSKNVPEALKLFNIEKAVEDYLKAINFEEHRQTSNTHALIH